MYMLTVAHDHDKLQGDYIGSAAGAVAVQGSGLRVEQQGPNRQRVCRVQLPVLSTSCWGRRLSGRYTKNRTTPSSRGTCIVGGYCRYYVGTWSLRV